MVNSDYRALALDVDGTLICPARKKVEAETTAALKKLQADGVVVILATGRSCFASTGEILGTDFIPDWRVCVNGAQILDASGTIVHEQRFSAAVVEDITAFTTPRAFPLTFTFEDAYYVYSEYEAFVKHYTANAGTVPYLRDGSDRKRHLSSLPYGAYIWMPAEYRNELAGLCPDIKLMETYPDSFDVSPLDADKRHGVEWILSRLGIGFDRLVAVGDSENDAGLLEAAGLGVAMADAPEHIRALADHVTGSARDNGVASVIKRFFGD